MASVPQTASVPNADVVVSGRYVEARRSLDLPWRGSTNQQVHFLTRRYGPTDMLRAPEVEFLIGADGALTVTGFPSEGLIADRAD